MTFASNESLQQTVKYAGTYESDLAREILDLRSRLEAATKAAEAALAAKDAEISRLRKLVRSVLAACDEGRMVGGGAGGMTIEANIRGSVYNGVPAWPIEEARAALEDTP